MRVIRKLLFTAVTVSLTTSCQKEIEKIEVQVDKQYSWTEVKQLYGTNQIILGMTQNGNSLFLQHPGFQGILSPQPTAPLYRQYGYISTAATYFPTDIRVRLPMSADFIAQPLRDTLVELLPPTDPNIEGYKAYVSLRKLDVQATRIISTFYGSPQPFGAVNRNKYLLFGYYTTNTDPTLRFVLTRVQRQFAGNLKAEPQTIIIPTGQYPGRYIRWIKAIDDYFLVNCDDAGLYKIQEDGTARHVYEHTVTDACYKWNGTVYMVEEYNSMLFSNDDGETWQRATGTPDLFNFTTYHVVSDSLIGITHNLISHLFTLRWNGTHYSARILKNDGLGQGDVQGMEQLGDTVYVGTTNGLFKRPLSTFFESKPKE